MIHSTSPTPQHTLHFIPYSSSFLIELKASLLTIRYEEPPLFLCLKVGKPKNTTVTYEAPFSTYGKAKKPEYWFTVSQEK